MATITKLSTPQFVLLTDLVQPTEQAKLNMESIPNAGDGWIKNPDHYRTDVGTVLLRKRMAERVWVNGCPYMRATALGVAHWILINAACRAKGEAPKVDRLYTITCVCGIRVQVVETVRLKDPHAIETEGAASVRFCPACHPEMFQGRTLPQWWTKRLPGDIPQRTLDTWAAEDQRRKDRMAQAANPRKRTK